MFWISSNHVCGLGNAEAKRDENNVVVEISNIGEVHALKSTPELIKIEQMTTYYLREESSIHKHLVITIPIYHIFEYIEI